MVREQHGLRRLHVGVTRHDHAKLALGALEHHGLHLGDGLEHLIGKVASDHVRVHRGLVVAGATRVETAARGSDALGEHALDGHVDVLVAVDVERELATFDLAGNLVEALADEPLVLGRNHALVGKHGGMRLGATDVLAPHALVERKRRAKALELAGGRGRETASPQRLGLCALPRCLRPVGCRDLFGLGIRHLPAPLVVSLP